MVHLKLTKLDHTADSRPHEETIRFICIKYIQACETLLRPLYEVSLLQLCSKLVSRGAPNLVRFTSRLPTRPIVVFDV